MNRDQNVYMSGVGIGIAIGIMGTMTAALLMGVGRPSTISTVSTLTVEQRGILLDCSGSPHIREKGHVLVVPGWKDDAERVTLDGRDIDIAGLICTVDSTNLSED